MTAEAPAPLCLMIAMPTQGQIATATVKSLLGLTQALQGVEIPFAFDTYEFSDIVFSRNQLLSRFLTDTRFSHVLLLDSDIAFAPEAVWRLIGFGAPFVATAYPQKHFDWAALRAEIEAEAARPPGERTPTEVLLSRHWIYNHQRADFGGGRWVPERRDGFVTVPATGTGLMLLSREVPERMVAEGVAAPLPAMADIPLHRGLAWHDFFGHVVSESGGFLMGEDQSFCWRWVRGCGGEIWLDCESLVHHVGSHAHAGRYADRLDRDFPPGGAEGA